MGHRQASDPCQCVLTHIGNHDQTVASVGNATVVGRIRRREEGLGKFLLCFLCLSRTISWWKQC